MGSQGATRRLCPAGMPTGFDGLEVPVEPPTVADLVTVYWRPGCPFCAHLRRGLHRAGITPTEIDIWQDPAAAATVRGIADGNETVPTVVVGDTGLVNPTVTQVLQALHAAAPGLAPPPPPPSGLRRLLGR